MSDTFSLADDIAQQNRDRFKGQHHDNNQHQDEGHHLELQDAVGVE